MKPPSAQGRPDDFQTPKEAIIPLLPYLKKEWIVWEPACGKGNLLKAFSEYGYTAFGTDILEGNDFLTSNIARPPMCIEWDCIITNPPFSLKQEFLERCYKLGKPFALLLPLTTFEGKRRQELFKKYGLEVILFDKRINFETPSGHGGGSWFATAWFTNGLNIGKQLSFVKIVEVGNRKLTEDNELEA